MIIKGEWESKRVWIDGNELTPRESLTICNHSPDGFNWSYSGSGPSQLALAICLKAFGRGDAKRYYQEFKKDFIAGLPAKDFEIDIDVQRWLREHTGGDDSSKYRHNESAHSAKNGAWRAKESC